MKSVRTLAFAALVALVLPMAAEDKKETKFEADKLLGDWSVTGGKKAGKDIGDDAKKGVYVITKDKITLKEGDKTLFVFSYTIPDAKATPTAIDMEITETVLDGAKGTKAKGIIGLAGDELKITYDPMGGDRPKKFDDDKAFAFVLKKKEAKKDK